MKPSKLIEMLQDQRINEIQDMLNAIEDPAQREEAVKLMQSTNSLYTIGSISGFADWLDRFAELNPDLNFPDVD